MPELILKSLITKHLDDIDYNRKYLDFEKSKLGSLKDTILYGDCDLTIIDKNTVLIDLPHSKLHESVYYDYSNYYNKILAQYKSITALLNSNSPKAWLVVTVYYHGFYCATLISRLIGRYNIYFSSSDTKGILMAAKNTNKYCVSEGNYSGIVVPSSGSSLTIKLTSSGARPHYMAWQLLSEGFSTKSVDIKKTPRFQRVQLFKSIIGKNERGWSTPSDVRNRWNYSDGSLYAGRGEELAGEFHSQLSRNNHILWGSQRNLYPDEKNVTTSLAFISLTLKNVLELCQERVIG